MERKQYCVPNGPSSDQHNMYIQMNIICSTCDSYLCNSRRAGKLIRPINRISIHSLANQV